MSFFNKFLVYFFVASSIICCLSDFSHAGCIQVILDDSVQNYVQDRIDDISVMYRLLNRPDLERKEVHVSGITNLLDECRHEGCINGTQRNYFERKFVEKIDQEVADKNTKLIITDFGSGRILPTFIFINKLINKGFRKFRVHLVDPIYRNFINLYCVSRSKKITYHPECEAIYKSYTKKCFSRTNRISRKFCVNNLLFQFLRWFKFLHPEVNLEVFIHSDAQNLSDEICDTNSKRIFFCEDMGANLAPVINFYEECFNPGDLFGILQNRQLEEIEEYRNPNLETECFLRQEGCDLWLSVSNNMNYELPFTLSARGCLPHIYIGKK